MPLARGGLGTVVPLALATVLEDEAHVHDFQVVQTGSGALKVRLADERSGVGRRGAPRAARVLQGDGLRRRRARDRRPGAAARSGQRQAAPGRPGGSSGRAVAPQATAQALLRHNGADAIRTAFRRCTFVVPGASCIAAAAVLVAAAAGGCSTLGYYAQSISGHLAMMRSARPIQDVVADPETPEDLRQAAAARAGDPGLRVQRTRTAGQRQLPGVRRPAPAVRGVERVRDARAVAGTEAVVLPGRRLRRVPRVLRPRRGRARGRGAASRRLRGQRGRRPRLFDARLAARPAAEHLHRRLRGPGRVDGVPRTRAPGRVRRRRHDLQRVLCHGGRARGRAALARRQQRPGAAAVVRGVRRVAGRTSWTCC